jgi:hypothetical protein
VGFNEIVAGAGVRRTEAWEYEAAFGSLTAGVLYVHAPQLRPPLVEMAARGVRSRAARAGGRRGELPPRTSLEAFPSVEAIVCPEITASVRFRGENRKSGRTQ